MPYSSRGVLSGASCRVEQPGFRSKQLKSLLVWKQTVWSSREQSKGVETTGFMAFKSRASAVARPPNSASLGLPPILSRLACGQRPPLLASSEVGGLHCENYKQPSKLKAPLHINSAPGTGPGWIFSFSERASSGLSETSHFHPTFSTLAAEMSLIQNHVDQFSLCLTWRWDVSST